MLIESDWYYYPNYLKPLLREIISKFWNKWFMEHVREDVNDFVFYLVDDDEDDQQLFKKALAEINQGITYLGFTQGDIFLKSLRTCHSLPDLIFLDLYMPIMDGESCLKILRKKMDLKNVPVIIYSSEKETDKLEGLLSMGANGFLKKSQSYSELLESLRNIHDKFLQNKEKPEVDFEYFIKESIINGY